MAQLLIENGANVNARGKDGETALKAAQWVGHDDMAELLKEAGASRPKKAVRPPRTRHPRP